MRGIMLSVLLFLWAPAIAQDSEIAQKSTQDTYALEDDLSQGFDSIHPIYKWEYSNLDQSFTFFKDTEKNIDLDSARSLFFQRPFPKIGRWQEEKSFLNDIGSVFWLHGRIKGSAEQGENYLFQVGRDLNSFGEINVYAVDPKGNIIHKRTGSNLLPAEKDIRDVFNFFRLSVPQDQVVDVYLRLEEYSHSFGSALSIRHIRQESMRELEGCLLKNTFLKVNSGERIKNYTKFNRSVEHIVDAGYTIEEVSNPSFWDRNARFNSWQEFTMTDTFWLRTRLINTEKEGRAYLIYLQKWTYADVYLPDESGAFQMYKSGTSRSYKEKAYRDPLNFFQVRMNGKDTLDVYTKVYTIYPSLSLPFRQEFVVAHVDERMLREDKSNNIFFIPFQGYLFAALVLSVAIFLMLPSRMILYFAICVLGNFLLTITGYPIDTFFELFPRLINVSVFSMAIVSFLISFGGVKFMSQFIDLSKFVKNVDKGFNVLFAVYFIATLLVIVSRIFQFEILQWLNISIGNFESVRTFMDTVFISLGTTAFFLVFLIPLFGAIKKIKYAWVLLLSALVPALSTTAWFLSYFFLDATLYPHLILGEPISQFVAPAFIGVFIFITLMAALIVLQARDANRERQLALQSQLASEQKVAEQLRKVDVLKDQFLANTSHELRTPLQGIIGLSESLFEREAEGQKREDLSMIISSGKRLNNLVNDILDFSKLKNFDIELMRKPINLYALVEVVLKNNAMLAKGKKLRLINAVPRELPAVDADENRLQQILYNLVGNAVKFTESGHIEVEAIKKGEMIRVSVKDTGVGIPGNKMEAIFQEFEQADASTSRQFSGTGLGLSISKQLIELHGGEIWVESEVGVGSTFYFTLPLSTEPATTLHPEPSINTEEATESATLSEALTILGKAPEDAIHILVVDDEPVNQRVLKNYLAAGPYRVTQAMNGEEALQKLEEDQTFDLVLLDIMMPKMSGYEVCQKIREKHLPSELPVIMVTAKNQVRDLVQGLALGANDYITKPFSKDEFLARLKTQLDLGRIFDVTGRFVPNEFIRSLGKDRITEITLGDHTELEVTVLFTDIRDYTSLAETMTPEETYRFVNAFDGRMGPVITNHHGFVNQYLGDAIMAIFPNKVEDALQAAVEMQQVIQKYNVHRLSKGRKPVAAGIGMHTGSLVMGIIGDQKRMDAATIADTVNTASRIESLTKYYHCKILLSSVTYDQIEQKDQFQFRYLGKVQVKGKEKSVGIYECFDGDTDESKTLKISYAQKFREGMEYYFSKDFSRASLTFQEIFQINPSDLTAKLFRDRAAQFIHQGVPDNWDGVERMERK
jgi:signal transduction histidine kinase/class 3 adenylate cyclase/ActR/RegA family two-component response regulator